MEKIYLVSQGEYSDYHVITVFSTKEKAKSFTEQFQHGDEMFIEERELDADWPSIPKGYHVYDVAMKKDGEVTWTEKYLPYDWEYRINNDATIINKRYKIMHHTCLAKSENQAIKITNEIRTRTIAENKWE